MGRILEGNRKNGIFHPIICKNIAIKIFFNIDKNGKIVYIFKIQTNIGKKECALRNYINAY